MWATCAIYKKCQKVNNRPLDENSAILVTLLVRGKLVTQRLSSFSRGGSGLIFLGLGWARAFSGLKNLLNKLGFSQARARALLHK
jgi:hypothetical protein